MSLSERAKQVVRRILATEDEDDPAFRAHTQHLLEVTFSFDPVLCIPPMAQASITPCGEKVVVTVSDSWGKRIAHGIFKRDEQSDVYRLVEGTASTSADNTPIVVSAEGRT